HELRGDRGAARPRLEHAALVHLVQVLELLQKLHVYERTLLYRTAHSVASLPLALLLPTTDDVLVGELALAGLLALRQKPPRRARMPAARGFSFTAAHRVIHGVHRDAPHVRPAAQPARFARLADHDVLVVFVADLPDRAPALRRDLAHLAGREPQDRIVAFLRHDLAEGAGAAGDLPALPRRHLDVVDERSERDRANLHRVPGLDLRVRTGDHRIAHLELLRRDDVALLAVHVV